jgi:predicted RNase H-like nuclease (RuvC/YqgF family)
MASDKFPLPKTIERISAAFPTKLSYPTQPLTRKEKNEMVEPYRVDGKRVWSNDHEKDALAAAIFAHNRVKPLMRRIRKKAPDAKADYVIMSVILKGRSIDESLKEFNAGEQIIINEKKSLGKVRRKGPAKKAY